MKSWCEPCQHSDHHECIGLEHNIAEWCDCDHRVLTVLKLLAEGWAVTNVGDKLGIGRASAQRDVYKFARDHGLRRGRTTQAVAYAVHKGWIKYG